MSGACEVKAAACAVEGTDAATDANGGVIGADDEPIEPPERPPSDSSYVLRVA